MQPKLTERPFILAKAAAAAAGVLQGHNLEGMRNQLTLPGVKTKHLVTHTVNFLLHKDATDVEVP